MRRHNIPLLTSVSIMSVIAFAQTATSDPVSSDGASQIQQAVEAYSGKGAPAIFTIKPDGDHYAFTFNPDSYLSLLTMPGKMTISPITGQIAAAGPNKWSLAYSGDFHTSFVSKPQAFTGAAVLPSAPSSESQVTLQGLTAKSVFDTSMMAFASENIHVDQAVAHSTQSAGNSLNTITRDSIEKNINVILDATPHDKASIDTHIVKTNETFSTTVVMPSLAPITMTTGKSITTITVNELRSHAFYDLWAWGVAHASKDQVIANQEDLRRLLRAFLPLFANAKVSSETENVSAVFDKSKITAAKASFASEATSNNNTNILSVASSVTGVAYNGISAVIPSWAEPLMPTDYTVGLEVSGFNLVSSLDAIASRFDLSSKDILSPDAIATITASLLPSGSITIKPQYLSFKSKTYDVSIDGTLTVGANAKPAGEITIHAKGIDAVLAALAEPARTDAKISQIATQVAVFNAMAKHPAPGESVWDIGFSADGAVTLNGAAIVAASRAKPAIDRHL